MECKRLFETIDKLYEHYLTVWEDVCNIESPTLLKEEVDKVGAYFINMAETKGWKIEVLRQEKSGNAVCITLNPESKLPPISLGGHIDTVHPLGSFGTPAVRLDDENIYGPGVMDCKGGIVAAFLAMDALWECGFDKRPVQLFLQPDEEVNSMLSNKETINYICKKAEGSVAFLNCESSRKGSVVLERKGIIRFRFDIKGKAIHSSLCPDGASAILEAAHKILKLETFKNMDGLTCNCGTIEGGTAPNSVPDSCTFVTDIRFSTSKELCEIRDYIETLCENPEIEGCTCTAEEIGFRPAMELTKANKELMNRMNEIYSANNLPILESRKSLGGSDAADITTHGIPCVDSIAVEGDYIHTTKEYAALKSLKESAKRIGAVCLCI